MQFCLSVFALATCVAVRYFLLIMKSRSRYPKMCKSIKNRKLNIFAIPILSYYIKYKRQQKLNNPKNLNTFNQFFSRNRRHVMRCNIMLQKMQVYCQYNSAKCKSDPVLQFCQTFYKKNWENVLIKSGLGIDNLAKNILLIAKQSINTFIFQCQPT